MDARTRVRLARLSEKAKKHPEAARDMNLVIEMLAKSDEHGKPKTRALDSEAALT